MTCSANVVGEGGSLRSVSESGRGLYLAINTIQIGQTMGAISGCVRQPRRLAPALSADTDGDGMDRRCKNAGSWRLCE